MCIVLFMSDSLSSVRSHSVHVAEFPMLRFSKGYCYNIFHPLSTKLYGQYGNLERIQAFTFSDDMIRHFDDKSPQLYCHYLYFVRPAFFLFFVLRPLRSCKKLTRHKIKVPIIYFIFPMGRFIFPKSTKWRTFSIGHVKKWKMLVLFLNLFPPCINNLLEIVVKLKIYITLITNLISKLL